MSERQYAEAFAAAKRAQEAAAARRLAEAVRDFQRAIRILRRLAVVESAAKRALLAPTIRELQARVGDIEAQQDYALACAMDEHALAKQEEEARGASREAVDRYITAGDWYLKALEALPLEDAATRAAVTEQLVYVIDHTSALKQQLAAADGEVDDAAERLATTTISNADEDGLGTLHWPEAPSSVTVTPAEKATAVIPTYAAAASGTAAPAVVAPLPNAGDKAAPGGEAYSLQELDVLRRSSMINGHLFLPWVDYIDSHEQFMLASPFNDPDGPVPLSKKQVDRGARWLRPSEYARICGKPPVMISTICPQGVKQDIVTDCSFVASLCIAAAYEQRFHKRLITNIVFPVDPDSKQPMYNPFGKYVVRLWANGVPRKVVIDDTLPFAEKTNQLLCSCTTQKNELWVSLIEKAYLKLNGGYDFPGGNSGIDLFALTGWIPERIDVSELTGNPDKEERLWDQMKSAFHYGDCIITMTAGDIPRDEAKTIGLVPMHVYAILNVYETTDIHTDDNGEKKRLRLLQVKNPWRKKSWRGPFSKHDTARWQSPLGDELRTYLRQFYGYAEVAHGDAQEDDGMFWIDFDSVKKYFESLYLNWNPELFQHKGVWHEHWPVSLGPTNDSITLGFNPQYSLTFPRSPSSESVDGGEVESRSGTVWVLLSRHVRTIERDTDYSNQQFLTLHVYRGEKGKRVFYNHRAVSRGTYSNNPHTLVSLDLDFSRDPELSFTLVASQYEKFASVDYTLSVFSTRPFECEPIPQLPTAAPTAIVLHDEWNATTAGGRPFYATFMNNPQFHISLDLSAACRSLYVFLETEHFALKDAASTSLPVNLRAVLHTRERVCGLPNLCTRQVDDKVRVLSSGEYRRAFCFISVPQELMTPDLRDLVLIPSAFESEATSKFSLRIVSDPPSTVTSYQPIPQEGFGMQLTSILGKWDAQTGSAAGCSNYGCYTFNPKYLVRVPHECSLFVRLLLDDDADDQEDGAGGQSQPSINVSVFESTSAGDLRVSTNPANAVAEATSERGLYVTGSPCGVVARPARPLPAGWYMIIPSTFEPRAGAFELRVYASAPVTVRSL